MMRMRIGPASPGSVPRWFLCLQVIVLFVAYAAGILNLGGAASTKFLLLIPLVVLAIVILSWVLKSDSKQRLLEIDGLLKEGLISQAEWEAKRGEILQQI